MSELDLGSSAPRPVETVAPMSDELVLIPPRPVDIVDSQQVAGAIPVEAGKQAELRAKANSFVAELVALGPRSPAFTDKVSSIASMGQQDIRAAAMVSNRLLDRPALGRGNSGGDAQTRVSNTLADLRTTITDLDPRRAELTGVRRLLKWLPGAEKIETYFLKYQSAQSHLNAIIKALSSGQDELRKDNAAIETERANMWVAMGKLSEYSELAGALDRSIGDKVAELASVGRSGDADVLRDEALFTVRQRRQDIMTQIAVYLQGYMALDLVRTNNLELIRGVDRAQTTTIAALRTAVIVSQALSRQKLVLDQITALNTATSSSIESTAQQIRDQGQQTSNQAAATAAEVARLQAAFDNVFATMDAVDTFRAQAGDSMAQTLVALEGQVARAKTYTNGNRRDQIGS